MMNKRGCRECPMDTNIVVDHASGDTICTECGLVLDQNYIDDTAEWRTLLQDMEHDRVRVGQASNPLLAHAGLSTTITQPRRSDINTNTGASSSNFGARWNNNAGAASNTKLVEAFREIETVAGRLNLNKVIQDQANEIFKNATEAKLALGVDTTAKVAACIYLACQQMKVPRTYKEMQHAACKTNVKSIGRASKQIQKGLQEAHQDLMKQALLKPEDLVPRLVSQLGLQTSESRVVQEIVKSCYACITDVGRTPKSVVAAVIYMTMRIQNKGEKPLAVLEEAVAKGTGISLYTLKGTYKELSKSADKIIPSWYADQEEMEYLN